MNYATNLFWQKPLFLLLVTLWSLSWKGLALWRAANAKQTFWFVALLALNTLGILEIIYLVWFTKPQRFWDKIQAKVSFKRKRK